MKLLRPLAGGMMPFGVLLATLGMAGTVAAEGEIAPPPAEVLAAPVNPVPAGPIQNLLVQGKLPRLRWGSLADFRQPLEQLYAQNGGQPLWIKGGAAIPEAAAMIDAFARADELGLNGADYDPDLLRAWANTAGANANDAAAFDLGLSLSAMRFLSNLAVGRVDPRSVAYDLDVTPRRPDLARLIQDIAQGASPAHGIASLEPQFPLYQFLKDALARYRELAKTEPHPHFAFPAKFKPGIQHGDIPALRRYLHALGDLTEWDGAAAESKGYDAPLADAVKRFQKRHGLGADGVIGGGTLQALNTPPGERVRQLQLGMERLRWLPEQRPGTRLMVNVPAFQVFGYRDGSPLGKPDLKINVIVGASKEGRHTPVFDADMTYISFRPYWNVPPSIAKKELLPILQRNPGYLARNNMELVGSYSSNSGSHAPTAGNLSLLASGAMRLRQKPGPHNALGLVKFAFPNHNNVYLHSTPNKSLFKAVRRDFSHGCIRVEDPPGLAEFLLSEKDGWNRPRIDAAFKASDSKIVNLPDPVHVVIFYSTAMADEDGRVTFYQDIYGQDAALQAELAKGFPYAVVKPPAKPKLPDNPPPENPSLQTVQSSSAAAPLAVKAVSTGSTSPATLHVPAAHQAAQAPAAAEMEEDGGEQP